MVCRERTLMKNLYEYFDAQSQEELFQKLVNDDPSVSKLNQYLNNAIENRLHGDNLKSQLSVMSYFKRNNCKPSQDHYYILTVNTKQAPLSLYVLENERPLKNIFSALYHGKGLHSGLIIYQHESQNLLELRDLLALSGDRLVDTLELKDSGEIYSLEYGGHAGNDRNDYEDLLTPESKMFEKSDLITFNNGILKHDIPQYKGDWIENDFSNDRNIYKEQFNFLEDFDQFQDFKNYFVVERLKGLHIEEDESKIQNLLKIDIQDKERETFNILTFDENYRVNDYQNITIGGIDTTIAEPKALMKYILNPKNKGFAVTHNHPSDVPLPSEADISITNRLHELGKSLDSQFYEHYIIGKAGVQRISQFYDLMLTHDKRDIQMKAAENLRKERDSNERSL